MKSLMYVVAIISIFSNTYALSANNIDDSALKPYLETELEPLSAVLECSLNSLRKFVAQREASFHTDDPEILSLERKKHAYSLIFAMITWFSVLELDLDELKNSTNPYLSDFMDRISKARVNLHWLGRDFARPAWSKLSEARIEAQFFEDEILKISKKHNSIDNVIRFYLKSAQQYDNSLLTQAYFASHKQIEDITDPADHTFESVGSWNYHKGNSLTFDSDLLDPWIEILDDIVFEICGSHNL